MTNKQVEDILKTPDFRLNWNETEIKIAKNRFSFFFNRPLPETVLKRDLEIPSEISINRDRSYSLSAGSAEQDEIDARYASEHYAKPPVGYHGSVPKNHAATAFRAIWQRFVSIAEHSSAFDDVVEIHEIIGNPDAPSALIKHYLRQPDEKELTKISNAINEVRVAPDKNGKQKLITKSALAKCVAFYQSHIENIDGATIEITDNAAGVENADNSAAAENTENPVSPVVRRITFADDRAAVIAHVDPLIMEMVVAKFVQEANNLLSD